MIPGMIVAGICFFYGVVWAAGGSVAEARAAGWLLGPFPEGVLWRSIDFAALDRRSFLLLAGPAQEAVTLITICLIVVLLYGAGLRSEEHTSEHQNLMRPAYAVFCLKKKN